MSKYGVISGPYFAVFNPNTGKYGPEVTPYLDTFHAVTDSVKLNAKFDISYRCVMKYMMILSFITFFSFARKELVLFK